MNLKNELTKLVDNKVISSAVATDIENYYNNVPKNTNRLFTIFGVLGAALVGLGIILIIAHNWDIFPKAVKVFFAFLPLIIGQVLVGYSIHKKKGTTWKESSGVFLFFAVGACISLIAQVYNISGNLSKFLMTWILICTPLIYLLKSKNLVVLHLIFSTYYAMETGYNFFSVNYSPWFYFLFIGLIFPFYIQRIKENQKANIVTLLNWLIPLSFIISFGSFIGEGYRFGYLLYVLMFGLLFNIGQELSFRQFKPYQNGYMLLGSAGILVLFMVASFDFIWESQQYKSLNHGSFYLSMGVLFLNLVFIIYPFMKNEKRPFLISSLAPFLFAVLFLIAQFDTLLPRIVINLFVFIWGVLMIYEGMKKLDFSMSNFGLLIVTALVICRFFDSDMSFVVRGVLFLCVGAWFFATNYFMLKKLKE